MTKKIISIILSLNLLTLSAFASVLGSTEIYSHTYEIGDNLFLNKNRFLSDQEGVGNQTENYFEYVPNEKTRPVVTLGKYVYGGEDINEIYSYLNGTGIRTLAGANGDFFSLSTGIPNGHVVIDKKIISTDERVLPALGIRDDGTAFIDDFQIVTKMYHNGEMAVVPFINKHLQRWGYYMYDSNYYKEITPKTPGRYVTLKITDGEMSLGGVLKTTVVSVEDDIEEKALNDGEVVIALTPDANPELFTFFDSFKEDDVVEFTFNANNEIWNEAEYILASDAGRILKDGEYVGEELAGASPRTAVGITDDGKMILYTIDGRQNGHSYGVRIPTLANRLKELGCVDVLNLDGGGSTSISAVLGGTDEFQLQNSPSDGRLRNDSTYIFFENVTPYTGEVSKLFLYPNTQYVKSGSKADFILTASDDGYHKASVPNAEYSVEGLSYMEDNSVVAIGDGISVVTAEFNGITATANVRSIETPQRIRITDKDGKDVNEIALEAGDTIDLNAIAYYNGMEIISQDTSYVWSADTGSITNDGLYTMGDENGNVTVSAGGLSVNIPIKADAFSDIGKNWARHYINTLFDKGIVNGFLENNEYIFKPGNYVTKNEMAVMLSKSLNLDTKKYEDTVLPFDDVNEIPHWALTHVKALYGEKIINGTAIYDKVYFYPQATVNRAEIFTIIGRILNVSGGEPAMFSDRDEIPDWAIDYIDALYEKGMINGYDDNMLKVKNSITRAEISKIIVKALY